MGCLNPLQGLTKFFLQRFIEFSHSEAQDMVGPDHWTTRGAPGMGTCQAAQLLRIQMLVYILWSHIEGLEVHHNHFR